MITVPSVATDLISLFPIHLYSNECAERYAGAKRSTAQFDDGYPVAGECAGDSSSLAAAVGEDV